MNRASRLAAAIVCAGLVLALPFATPALAGDKDKSHEVTAEVVSVDTDAKTITIKNEKGEASSAPVLEGALAALQTVKAGDKVTLTCLDDESGNHKGVIAIKVKTFAKK